MEQSLCTKAYFAVFCSAACTDESESNQMIALRDSQLRFGEARNFFLISDWLQSIATPISRDYMEGS